MPPSLLLDTHTNTYIHIKFNTFIYYLPSPPSLAQPLLFSMCNLKLICTTGYLTGATDTESVLFLLKHSMELTLNLNKTNLN